MGNRFYDTATGRFLSRDPAGAGQNGYAYCGNNPVSNLDPLGLEGGDSNSGALGAVVAVGGAIAAGWNDIKNFFGFGHRHWI